MICEKCGKEHNGSYGSGRFCSEKCARSFSTINDDKKDTKKVKCIICNNEKIINKRASSKNFICKECRLKNTYNKKCKICGKKIRFDNKRGYCVKCINKNHLFTEETLTKFRNNAINREFWKYKKKHIVKYNNFKFDSSYEIKVAKSLDENNIKWEKPKSFYYHFNDKKHIYTADFYLPEYDVYLDPKNDFLIENINPGTGYKDIDKIKQVEVENNIRVIILNKNELSWDKIKLKLGPLAQLVRATGS